MGNKIKLANIRMLEFVAKRLDFLCDEVVFLGGCTTALFITDQAVPDVRYTLDVDCIVDVISFQDALPGHFIHYRSLADERIKMFMDRVNDIASL